MKAKILREQIDRKNQKKKSKRSSRISYQCKSESNTCLLSKTGSCTKTYLPANTNLHQLFIPQQLRNNCKKKTHFKKSIIKVDKSLVYTNGNLSKKRNKVDAKTNVLDLACKPKLSGICCICRHTDDIINPMIQCNTCNNWFHFSCLNISQDNVLKIYTCSSCRKKILENSNKSKISPLDLLILAVENQAKEEGDGLKRRTTEETRENTGQSCDYELELKSPKQRLQLAKTGRSIGLVLKDPKYVLL